MPVIELEGVTKSYGRHRGISEVTLSVGRGEVFGYLGPNGAGKTTTIRLLLDLIRPSSGRVLVFGSPPSDLEARSRIGYLPGELALYEDLTGAELIDYLDHLRGGGSRERARDLADRLHLDTSRRIAELSRGNKQKVGLVQAFMHQPDLLILDEPTSGLDPLVQREVYRMIDEAKAGEATVFLSSHILSEVERVAERVGIIRQGVLVEVAPLEELRAKAVRRFEITFAGPVPAGLLEQVEHVSDVQVDGQVVSCAVVGPVDPLIKAISKLEVLNVISHGADLEDLFLSYYRGESHAA